MFAYNGVVIIVCDGTEAADKHRRVLWNDPSTGVMRRRTRATRSRVECAQEQGLKLPMML